MFGFRSQEPNYAGVGSIFAGKGEGCGNCQTRRPVNVFVDVTRCLERMGKTRHEVSVVVRVCDEEGNILNLEDTPLPQPVLEGPKFDGGGVFAKTEQGGTHLIYS